MLTPETPSLTYGDGDEPLLLVVALVVRRSYVAGSRSSTNETGGGGDSQLFTRVKATEANEVKTENRIRGCVLRALLTERIEECFRSRWPMSFTIVRILLSWFRQLFIAFDCHDHDNDNASIR